MTLDDIARVEREFEEMLRQLPNDDYGKLMRAVVAKGVTVEQKEFLLDQGRTADSKIRQIGIHVTFARQNIVDIVKGTATVNSYAYLPTQLWMALDEMPRYFGKHLESAKQWAPHLGVTTATIGTLSDIVACLGAIRKTFSDDEIQAIEFLRQYYCHLQARKYAVQWNPKTQGFDRDLEGKSRTDVRKTIQAVLDTFGGNVKKLSIEFAGRVVGEYDKLYHLVDKWSSAEVTIA